MLHLYPVLTGKAWMGFPSKYANFLVAAFVQTLFVSINSGEALTTLQNQKVFHCCKIFSQGDIRKGQLLYLRRLKAAGRHRCKEKRQL